MGLIEPYLVVFIRQHVFTITKVPQLWRLVTGFILTGPKLGMILDPYFLYTYGSALETEAARFSQPGDFFVYLIFVALVILVSGCGLSYFYYPCARYYNLVYLPVQPILAVTVPGNEGDCPCTLQRPHSHKP